MIIIIPDHLESVIKMPRTKIQQATLYALRIDEDTYEVIKARDYPPGLYKGIHFKNILNAHLRDYTG
jgi:hypothetical protein